MPNRVQCGGLQQFALLCAHFQREGLAFTAYAEGLYIDITGY
jgi:hypothetical protein